MLKSAPGGTMHRMQSEHHASPKADQEARSFFEKENWGKVTGNGPSGGSSVIDRMCSRPSQRPIGAQ